MCVYTSRATGGQRCQHPLEWNRRQTWVTWQRCWGEPIPCNSLLFSYLLSRLSNPIIYLLGPSLVCLIGPGLSNLHLVLLNLKLTFATDFILFFSQDRGSCSPGWPQALCLRDGLEPWSSCLCPASAWVTGCAPPHTHTGSFQGLQKDLTSRLQLMSGISFCLYWILTSSGLGDNPEWAIYLLLITKGTTSEQSRFQFNHPPEPNVRAGCISHLWASNMYYPYSEGSRYCRRVGKGLLYFEDNW